MRDNNLCFHDGTNFTATVTPVSTTRSGGSAVLDIGKTGIDGLWVQAALAVAIVGAAGTIDIKLQGSDAMNFASGIDELGSFPQLNNTSTVVPWRQSKKIVTKKRYLRAVLTVGGTVTTETLYVNVVSGPDRDDVA